MKSEAEREFLKDAADKKRTARGSHNRKSTRGRSGSVRFPSDYLTEKERKAMSGEVKSYKLGAPMRWAEFKAMPDDLRVTYIRGLRETYRAPDTKIHEMLGISHTTCIKEFRRLGLCLGRNNGLTGFDKAGWEKWLEREEPIPTMEAVEEITGEVPVPARAVQLEAETGHDWDLYRMSWLLGRMEGLAYGLDGAAREQMLAAVEELRREVLGNRRVGDDLMERMEDDGK